MKASRLRSIASGARPATNTASAIPVSLALARSGLAAATPIESAAKNTAIEMPSGAIGYPELARLQQTEAWQRWCELNPPKEREPAPPPLFKPIEPGPCPYCGEPLRSSKARQCRFCKMDWHDSQNIHRRVQKESR